MQAVRRPPTLAALVLLASLPTLRAQGTNVDWIPSTAQVTLNTESTTILTSVGWITVKGGVFVFRNVTIPQGTVVRGDGKNPLIFVLAGTFKLDGELSVRGGDGQSVPTINTRSAHIPVPGGKGVCGGGNGGRGSPNTVDRSFRGEAGYGPFNFPGFGGGGGRINCANPSCGIGSGGGGGSFSTTGDPYYKLKATSLFVQPNGVGAFGCTSRSSIFLAGGAAGPLYFVDPDPANNFLGIGFDVNRRLFIRGELPFLVGGSGGAGGGDFALSCASRDPGFANDFRGGGGGAGGGVVCILAHGPIQIGADARIDAAGGDGGGGAWLGSSNRGGGGGAGAGGFVALYSRTQLDIAVHGETYANNDFDFAISADGGVGRLALYAGGGNVTGEYPPTSVANMNARPSGGFGGLGIIQLMTPIGTANVDGTNTLLDDNILLRGPRGQLVGAEKQRYFAWRGFPNAQGVLVDDRGNPLNIGDKAGDFRPTPILLPVF